jgi:NADPH2:quinone reductase
VVSFGSLGGNLKGLDPIELDEAGSLFVTHSRLADHLNDAPAIRRRAADVFAALIDGNLSIDEAGRYGFGEIEMAHEALEHRTTIGKPMLQVAGSD